MLQIPLIDRIVKNWYCFRYFIEKKEDKPISILVIIRVVISIQRRFFALIWHFYRKVRLERHTFSIPMCTMCSTFSSIFSNLRYSSSSRNLLFEVSSSPALTREGVDEVQLAIAPHSSSTDRLNQIKSHQAWLQGGNFTSARQATSPPPLACLHGHCNHTFLHI